METIKEETILSKEGDFILVKEQFITKHSKEELGVLFKNFEKKLEAINKFLQPETSDFKKKEIERLTQMKNEKNRFIQFLSKLEEKDLSKEMKDTLNILTDQAKQVEQNIAQLSIESSDRVHNQALEDKRKIEKKLAELKPYV